MVNPSNTALLNGAKVARAAARMLSALILVVWGYFIVAYLIGDEGNASRPLIASDYVGLIAMGAWLIGLAVAWKWEFIGGMMALLAFAISVVANSKMLSFPFVIIPLAAVLFLASWWMRREPRDGTAEGGPSI